MRYENKTWEPVFKDISPFWSKVYFATDNGYIRILAAKAIFKKLSITERIVWFLDEH